MSLTVKEQYLVKICSEISRVESACEILEFQLDDNELPRAKELEGYLFTIRENIKRVSDRLSGEFIEIPNEEINELEYAYNGLRQYKKILQDLLDSI